MGKTRMSYQLLSTRYPNEKGILLMTERLPEIASRLENSGFCDDVIDDIKNWDHGLQGLDQVRERQQFRLVC